jgi:hypothetical protein
MYFQRHGWQEIIWTGILTSIHVITIQCLNYNYHNRQRITATSWTEILTTSHVITIQWPMFMQ